MTEPFDVSLRVKLDYQAGAAAKTAVSDLEAVRTAAGKLGAGTAGPAVSGDGLQSLSAAAIAARQAIAGTATEAQRLQAAIRAQRSVGGFANGAELEAFLQGFGKISKASEQVGRADGPRKLTAALGTVAAGAAEARREVDALARAEAQAAKDAERLGAAGGGRGGGGRGESPGGGAPGGHGAGGWRKFERAVAMPFRLERASMLAMSAGGAAGLGLGYGLYAIEQHLSDATKRAIELEDRMLDVRRTLGDVPQGALKGLESDLLRTSRATGTTIDELGRMAAAAAAAGRPAAELPRFMELGAKAATAFGERSDEIAGKLAKLGADFGLDEAGIQRAADAAALLQERTGARGGATLGIVAGAGPAAHLTGMAPEQLAAFGAGMSKLGMGEGDAASLFGGLLDKLANAPLQGEGFKRGLTRMSDPSGNIENPYALRQAARADPSQAMLRFLGDVKSLAPNRRVMVLSEMFGPEEGEKIARLADHLDEFRKNLAAVQDTGARTGAVDRVFRLFDDATSKRIDKATAAIGAFAAKVGQALAPAVGAAADATARLFNALSDVMDRAERASAAADILEAKRAGQSLTEEQKAAIGTDPRLRAMTGDPDAKPPPLPPSLVPNPPVPRSGAQPELTDPEVSQARARARERLEGRVRELEGQKAIGAGGADIGRQLDSARHKLDDFDRKTAPRPDKHAAIEDRGLFRPAAYRDDDDQPARPAGGAASDLLQAAVEAGTKAGVIAAFREVTDLRGGGARGGLTMASWEDGADVAGGGAGGADAGAGGSGSHGAPNLRYGRESAGAALPNLRYGRAGSGFRDTPAARSRGRYRRTPGGASAGGWTIGEGDGTATTQDTGPGFTSGMRARNLGNIGYFGQHEPGLVGPSNAHDVDHSIALFASQEDGIRAAARLALRKYQGGMRDTASLIAGKGGWTPGALGPGASVNIAQAMGLTNHDDLHLDDPGQLRKFLGALARQEHGAAGAYYTPEMIDRALKGGAPSPGIANADRTIPGGDRRGFANLMHGQYGAPGENLVSITTPSGKRVTVHREAAASFQGFLGDLEKRGYGIDSLGGYANRGMAGNPGRISQHAYGNAIDINPSRNPFHSSRTDLPSNVSEMAAKWGLSWGGDWSPRSRDPMHFEWTGARPWENKAGPTATAGNTPPVMPFGLTGAALEAMDRARVAKAAASSEDRLTRSTAAERDAAAPRAKTPGRPAPPRFETPGRLVRASATPADDGGGQGGGSMRGAAGGPSVVQHFHGQHDPAETARYARRESNRAVRQAQARALYGIGRVA